MGLLDGRSAVVTGAAQGIGYEIARVFAENGASVVIADMNGDAAEDAASKITAGVAPRARSAPTSPTRTRSPRPPRPPWTGTARWTS